ncbi:N-myc downstream regulated [Thecamonas trahens ATCC 50062]|uniref:N-myc downstream regulated n=1 Tax=Thecamonas trahens ATCC 50062 TaxID=461836 RepID=A0A0L0DE70_THETB|nr:N-myc downstream regulated [Thecamonas trahens ATCC 50062]KNC50617.1 N-myc downstream regulated [Thecamonas trahens ATCC 50062]|eukprot:XP_013762504.1 N-myc downstream regulated [Thecamonas trahens ATCC 50062]
MPIRRLLFPYFAVYAIDAPGQAAGEAEMAADAPYPEFGELVEQVGAVMDAFGVESAVLMGVGAGGTVLTHFALSAAHRVKGLVVIGATHKAPGWLEWAYSHASQFWLSWWGVDGYVKDQLMQRYFTWREEADEGGLMRLTYQEALANVKATNLWKFIASYMARPPLDDAALASLTTPVIFFVGRDSYYYDDVVDFFGAFNSESASWVPVWGAGNMVHMEMPQELVTPLRLFFYRCGHVAFGLAPKE